MLGDPENGAAAQEHTEGERVGDPNAPKEAQEQPAEPTEQTAASRR